MLESCWSPCVILVARAAILVFRGRTYLHRELPLLIRSWTLPGPIPQRIVIPVFAGRYSGRWTFASGKLFHTSARTLVQHGETVARGVSVDFLARKERIRAVAVGIGALRGVEMALVRPKLAGDFTDR
jgi:hypothetical protein